MRLHKPKPCKGNGNSNFYPGCGKEVVKRTYGLCGKCYWDWMNTTPEGLEHKKKNFIPRVQKRTAQTIKKKNLTEKKRRKVENMTVDEYRSKYIQPGINKIARLIDQGHPCIATGNFGKMNGGHYISVGANRTTALNLHNIFIQSFESNHFKSGDNLKYQQGLINVFGQEYFDFVDSLRQIPPLKFTKQDLIELKPKITKTIKVLELANDTRTPLERIRLRNWANKKLGIYSEEYGIYSRVTEPQLVNI